MQFLSKIQSLFILMLKIRQFHLKKYCQNQHDLPFKTHFWYTLLNGTFRYNGFSVCVNTTTKRIHFSNYSHIKGKPATCCRFYCYTFAIYFKIVYFLISLTPHRYIRPAWFYCPLFWKNAPEKRARAYLKATPCNNKS